MSEAPTALARLALNTASLGHNMEGAGAGWPVERVIDACAEGDFSGISFWRREIGARAVDIGERVRGAGLEVVGLCRTPFLVGSLAPPGRQDVMDEVRRSIDMAAGLGAPLLTVVVGGVEPGTRGLRPSLDIVADRVAEAADYAAERGVKLALEPLHPVHAGLRSCLTTTRDAVDLCERIGADAVGLAIDVYHVWWDGDLAAQLARAGAGRIHAFHLCDWLADPADVLFDRGMMGDGIADIPALRATLETAGYTGPQEVEIFSAGNWWRRDPGEVLHVMVERFRTVC